ncbi:MAG: CvpA family protein [Candidatus Binataceae bacterium]
MNGLDYAIIAMLACGAAYGVARGALRLATSAISLAAGIYMASIHHAEAGDYVHRYLGLQNPALEAAVGYVAVFAIVFAAVEIAGRFLIGLLRIVNLGWADRILGATFGAVVALVAIGMSVVMLTALLPGDSPILRDSKLAPDILAYSRMLPDYVPEQVKDAYQARRDELLRFWLSCRPTPQATPAPPAGHPS